MHSQSSKSVRYKVIKRKIKYARLEIKNNLIYIILPEHLKMDHKKLLEKYKKWIDKKLKILNEIKDISKDLKLFNHNDFEDFVLIMVEKYSHILNQKPASVSFRWMKRRWGSCHGNNKIIFNKYLKFVPKELIEYVVIHEMCHLKIKNHRREFWLLVKKLCPDFLEREKLLAGYKIKLNLSKVKNRITNSLN